MDPKGGIMFKEEINNFIRGFISGEEASMLNKKLERNGTFLSNLKHLEFIREGKLFKLIMVDGAEPIDPNQYVKLGFMQTRVSNGEASIPLALRLYKSKRVKGALYQMEDGLALVGQDKFFRYNVKGEFGWEYFDEPVQTHIDKKSS